MDAVEIYSEAVGALARDLQALAPRSRGLRGLRDYLSDYAGSPSFIVAGRRDAGAKGGAGRDPLLGADSGAASDSDPVRGRPRLQRGGAGDVRPLPAGGGEELPGEPSATRRR